MSTATVPSEARRVVLIDLSSIYHPAWRASANEPLSTAFDATIESVTRCAKKDPNALVAICLDSRKSFRKELVPTYKANRDKLGNDFYETLAKVKDRLIADGYILWEADSFEADDVIASATENAVARGHDVVICSADKDLMQLLRPGVRQFRTHDNSMWTDVEAETKFGVKVSQIGDWLALVGDTSDNIKGAPGVGPKTATDLLSRFGGLDALYVQISADPLAVGATNGGKTVAKFVTAIDLAEDDVRLARKLVELRRDVPIKFDDIYQERAVKPLHSLEEVPMNEPQAAPPPEVESETVAIGELVDMPKQPEPPQSKALATTPANPQLQPSSVADAYWLAKAMVSSRLYAKFGNAEAVLATMIRGKEMGFPVLTSLDLFHVIQGRPTLAANTIQALADRHPDCTYLRKVSSSDKEATWETKHAKYPEPTQHTYTIEDAVAAGIATEVPAPPPPPNKKDDRGQWDKRRKEMLRKTAMVQLVRMVYPSATLGLYAREELTDREED